jgi:hypothetical protein
MIFVLTSIILAFAMAVHAEATCAWVLWVEESWVVALKRDERPIKWTLVEAPSSQAECNQAASEKLMTLAKHDGVQLRQLIPNRLLMTPKVIADGRWYP